MLRQQISEVGAGQRENDGGLDRRDGCGSGLAGQQRHFADRSAFAKLGDQEIDAGRRVLLAHLDQSRLDDVHRNAGRAFANDHFGRRKLRGLQAGSRVLARLSGLSSAKSLTFLRN